MKLLGIFFFISFHTLWAQCVPQFNIKGLGKDNYVNPGQDSIKITGIENTLNIEFVNCADSIRYTLMGFEHGINTSMYPIITYHNLYGGEYILKYWIAKLEKTIYVNVEQPIWQKWWFIPMLFLYLLLIVGLGIYFFYLHNFRQKMKLMMLRNKLSADLHDEVGSNLNSIAIYAKLLMNKSTEPGLKPLLNKIILNSKESVDVMQDTVWNLNPNNDTIEKFIFKIDSFAREVLPVRGVQYTLKNEILNLKADLDMQKRKNIYLILKEAINNIAKHSQAKKAEMRIFEQDKKIIFSLDDDGRGFDMAQNSEGNGLKNYEYRAKEAGFGFEIESKPGQGTKIRVTISP